MVYLLPSDHLHGFKLFPEGKGVQLQIFGPKQPQTGPGGVVLDNLVQTFEKFVLALQQLSRLPISPMIIFRDCE